MNVNIRVKIRRGCVTMIREFFDLDPKSAEEIRTRKSTIWASFF